MIYSDKKVNIYFKDIEESGYYYDKFDAHFLVKNKTNTELPFQGNTITLDGVSYNNIIMSDPVAQNSIGTIEATVESKPNTLIQR